MDYLPKFKEVTWWWPCPGIICQSKG